MAEAIIGIRAIIDAVATLLARGVYSIHLFKNNYTPTAFSFLTDFVEADYPGYPAGGITPVLPTYGTMGTEGAMSPVLVEFPAPTSGPDVFIFGFWVRFTPNVAPNTPAMLLAAHYHPVPNVLSVNGATLPVILDFRTLDLHNP